ncbi:DUF58 domain-containing protein [Olivibacter domesticus]|uniref:Uncharacterized conserved protein, DUF58 family, contains vWF domain n=1 Tax=Olivibacter domesticus TaxID=407022 RepID=A0A1H7TF75_OLID1|nr:DUF58 domain-containing protein [Olivibacter domesticus]SEL83530.1 Uncharacterized conserved protein, DUF58 family, contains vWF domain [Olivibacter domesticus]
MNRLFRLFYTDLFLCSRLFIALGLAALLFLFSFFFPWLGIIPVIFLLTVAIVFVADLFLLYASKGAKVTTTREVASRLSNSDDNDIHLTIKNHYPFNVHVGIIDEIPTQFQRRDIWFNKTLLAKATEGITYQLRPVKRGIYAFGDIHTFVQSPIKFIQRRFNSAAAINIPVYPSFLQMRRYELLAISDRLSDYGLKKIRRLGHSMEFEQIKTYVQGDDYRTLNWKATARHGNLMVNSYIDERSQHVYCIIDKSRSMKMPFDGLSLLDYAINASLVLSNIALKKEDKAGLITVSEKIGSVVPADKRPIQLHYIMEVLYKEKTRYLETNMEVLYSIIRRTMKQRSLVLLFSNFESISALNRQLPYLKKIAQFHLLVVIFFENTELTNLSREKAYNVEGIYLKTIAEKFVYEKKMIVRELTRHGIQSILSPPHLLTVNTINKYLEIKAKQKI